MAFAPIELLVVIAIIAILIGLLLPASGMAQMMRVGLYRPVHVKTSMWRPL